MVTSSVQDGLAAAEMALPRRDLISLMGVLVTAEPAHKDDQVTPRQGHFRRRQHLLSAAEMALSRGDLIIFMGGLGRDEYAHQADQVTPRQRHLRRRQAILHARSHHRSNTDSCPDCST